MPHSKELVHNPDLEAVGPHGHLCLFYESEGRVTGFKAEEVMGKPLLDLIEVAWEERTGVALAHPAHSAVALAPPCGELVQENHWATLDMVARIPALKRCTQPACGGWSPEMADLKQCG
jgi:hypothetical protein